MELYTLEKEYSISPALFEKGYLAFQKKYVYPKNRIFAVIFLFLTADFVYAAVKDPSNYFTYVLIFTCFAFALRELFNPSRIRNRYVDTVEDMGEIVYKIGLGDSYIDISTVSIPEMLKDPDEIYEEEPENPDEPEGLPDATRLPLDDEFSMIEYNEFFLIFYGKTVFYILPKEGFSENELELVRKLDK